MAVFGNFCPKSISDKFQLIVFDTSILKLYLTIMPLPKIKICLKYIMDKNPIKPAIVGTFVIYCHLCIDSIYSCKEERAKRPTSLDSLILRNCIALYEKGSLQDKRKTFLI